MPQKDVYTMQTCVMVVCVQLFVTPVSIKLLLKIIVTTFGAKCMKLCFIDLINNVKPNRTLGEILKFSQRQVCCRLSSGMLHPATWQKQTNIAKRSS